MRFELSVLTLSMLALSLRAPLLGKNADGRAHTSRRAGGGGRGTFRPKTLRESQSNTLV